MSTRPTLVWFRHDLRLSDQPALSAALASGGAVIPVFIFDDEGKGAWSYGGASRWWLSHSLTELSASIASRGGRLILRRGSAEKQLQSLVNETGAGAVYWNRRYEPSAITEAGLVETSLARSGVDYKSWNGTLLFDPEKIVNKEGSPFKVFTPYWRHCLALPVENPTPVRLSVWPAPKTWPKTEKLEQWSLLPDGEWSRKFSATSWRPGERGANERMRAFLSENIDVYDEEREYPARERTSCLSPHLHFGEITPKQIWAALHKRSKETGVFPSTRGEMRFVAELGWREFANYLLYHFPDTQREPLREDFRRFPWTKDATGELFRAWSGGQTGYPIVDAGMRELWATGWMHNRVRMIVASFLVKHLRLSWLRGAEWFWNTLFDADLAANTLGWQWCAGCGADAAPYFRIFNPVLQGRKYDASGAYVRKWVPELGGLPDAWIHEPWAAPESVLEQGGVVLGRDYPKPIVEHMSARREALAVWKQFGKAIADQKERGGGKCAC